MSYRKGRYNSWNGIGHWPDGRILPMTPPRSLRGWGPRGQRLRGFAPHGHWRTLTFLGALRCDKLTAPCVFDGPINSECFRAYVQQEWAPVLRPGDIVVMDNLGSHKSAAVRQAI